MLTTCECTPAPAGLLARGLMACSPTHPTLAIDVKLLELARLQFLHMAPNASGWCAALESFLSSLGYKLQTRVRALTLNGESNPYRGVRTPYGGVLAMASGGTMLCWMR